VVECIGELYEVAFIAIDSQLDLAKYIPVLDVDENIISSLMKSVHHPNKLNIPLL